MAANYDPVHFILSIEMIRADLGSLFCTRVQMSNVIKRKLHWTLNFKHPPRPALSRAIKLPISLENSVPVRSNRTN